MRQKVERSGDGELSCIKIRSRSFLLRLRILHTELSSSFCRKDTVKVNCSDDVLDISHTCARKHTKLMWVFNQLGICTELRCI